MNEIISQLNGVVSMWWVGLTVSAGLALAAVAPVQAQQPPEYTQRSIDIAADGLDHLQARLANGAVTLQGEPGLQQVVVEAHIYHYDAEDIVLTLVAEQGAARLEANFGGGSYSGAAPYINLHVRVPHHFSAEIEHGDGEVIVHELAGMLSLQNGAGDIQVSHVGGVHIEHRSGGKVNTRNIHGPVRIRQR